MKNRLSAYAIYRELSQERLWSQQSSRVRWLAARYYADVDPNVLRLTERQNYGDHKGPALLTTAEADMIRMLR